ncbi:hypothetical protein VFPPC_17871 [Pochonia chlamydosporia 170]|uniref:Uncharacterized protein n=1 Tax=Pochonia chlamydosporia 170 TaxID=1380566 RepID=A0A219AQ73_METCM|nr:hypothetical protein VFPPC_17871 [Pochonia chlamydosporia 170]OWT42936.1 hypothetical protein VFPPC_17871 [Pochonia chlamydosporia 170]
MRDLHSPELSSYAEPSPLLTSDTGIFQTYDPVLYGTSTGYAVDAYKKRNRGSTDDSPPHRAASTPPFAILSSHQTHPSHLPSKNFYIATVSTFRYLQLVCLSNTNHGRIPSSFHVVDSVRVN